MEINSSSFFGNYRERIKRLALYEPLIALQNKNMRDLNNHKIDMYDLGLVSLLYFYECKLIRQKEVGLEALSTFLFKTAESRYQLDVKKSEAIAQEIIRTFRPSSGKRLFKVYYDWEKKREETLYYSILKAGRSDIASNKQYYELDEDGLELIFSTREYYSEFQISINQMLLRKQLEKGEFLSALRQIDEMQVNVESLYERIIKIKNDIARSVVSEDVYLRYKQLIDDIYQRLEFENKEFKELRAFVQTVLSDMKFKEHNERDKHIYRNALEVRRALEEVHILHDGLLKKCIEIQTSALMAAKESLYYSGVESFNFNSEIIAYIATHGTSLNRVRTIAKPFMPLEREETWSPLAVFFPQRIYRREKGDISFEFLKMEGVESEDGHLMELFYGKIMTLCLEALKGNNTLKLSEFIEMIRTTHEPLLRMRPFYSFWLILHQLSPINLLSDKEDQTHSLLKGIAQVLNNRYKGLTVLELKTVIEVEDSLWMSDLIMCLEEKYEI